MIFKDDKIELLLNEVESIKNRYEQLHLKLNERKAFLIGNLVFNAIMIGETISDSYQIEIEFPRDYPDIPPSVKEIGGRINNHLNPENTLCLGPPLKILLEFQQNPTVLYFIERILIPILCWHTYREINSEVHLPYYSRGNDGIKEYHNETNIRENYFKVFNLDNINVVLLIIKMILDDTYKNNPRCPCRSRQKIRDCHHGKDIQLLLEMPHMKQYIHLDYNKMLKEAIENGEIDDIRPFSDKRRIRRLIKNRVKKRK